MAIGLRAEIERFAKSHRLEPDLVHAVILVESAEVQHSYRPEPQYGYLWDNKLKQPFRKLAVEERKSEVAPDDFYDIRGWKGKDANHEWWGQQMSWGYMQVMGAVAREEGFKEIFLTNLIQTGYNLEYGCTLLAKLNRWAGGEREAMLAAYNGGRGGNEAGTFPKRNQAYVDKCLGKMAEIKRKSELT